MCSGPGHGNATPLPAIDVKSLHAKIGELTLENDFLEGALTKAGLPERKAMIDREHDLPITKQAEVFEDQPRQRLLSAAPGVVCRPRDHAAARPAASGVSFRRFAHVARPAGCRGEQDRPPACQDADAAGWG